MNASTREVTVRVRVSVRVRVRVRERVALRVWVRVRVSDSVYAVWGKNRGDPKTSACRSLQTLNFANQQCSSSAELPLITNVTSQRGNELLSSSQFSSIDFICFSL